MGSGTIIVIAGNNSNIYNLTTAIAVNSNLLFGLGGLSFDDDFFKDFY